MLTSPKIMRIPHLLFYDVIVYYWLIKRAIIKDYNRAKLNSLQWFEST